MTRYTFPGSQRGFLSVFQLYNIVHWESQSMVCQHAKFSTENRNLPSHYKAYLCVSVIRALFSLYFLHRGCFYNLIICPHECTAERGTNMHTYIHTPVHTSMHTFQKTISRNKVRAHSQPTVGMHLV